MITELLQKLGLKVEELSPTRKDPETGLSEKETYELYEKWEQIIKEEMTPEKIKEFLQAEMARIQIEFSDPANTPEKDFFLKAQIRNYRNLMMFIDSPKSMKEKYENHLKEIGSKVDKQTT